MSLRTSVDDVEAVQVLEARGDVRKQRVQKCLHTCHQRAARPCTHQTREHSQESSLDARACDCNTKRWTANVMWHMGASSKWQVHLVGRWGA